MSGFVGLFGRSPSTADAQLVAQMTELMGRDCPDRLGTWIGEGAGLGHALLAITREDRSEQQPLSMGGDVHIVGDVRLDRRDEVIATLAENGATSYDSDTALVLRAYHRWGESCIDHFSGDFAFAIWDSASRKLFCVRDHFGIVPLYYAEIPAGLIISTHIQCILAHPDVSEDLNETAIGDFLLFSMNLDRGSTVFASIQKLPPAHLLTWTGDAAATHRYWQHATDVDKLHHKSQDDYVDEFLHLLEYSVADRLRTDKAATHLSGGLDSTSIAAITRRLGTRGVNDLQAYNITYRELLLEDEGRLAKEVAGHIGVPLDVLFAEDFIGAEPPDSPSHVYPEPHIIPSQVAEIEIASRVSQNSRVLLAGFGGDPALFPPDNPFGQVLKGGRIVSAIGGLFGIYRRTGRLPRPGLRTWLRKNTAADVLARTATLPDWIDAEFAGRTHLVERLRDTVLKRELRDRAGMAIAPTWSNIFAWSHPGFSGQPLKTRFPFFDLRLVTFLERVPPLPWLHDKILLREAMRGILPEGVRLRRKSPLPGSGQFNHVQRDGIAPWAMRLANSKHLDGFVNRKTLVSLLSDHKDLDQIRYRQTRPAIHMAYWLNQR
ncbi:MAG: asparagine synthase-related protein [Pseudomonadota bacterium]